MTPIVESALTVGAVVAVTGILYFIGAKIIRYLDSKNTQGRRICAWCKADMGPSGTAFDTHGACPACFTKEMEKIKNL